MENPSPGERSIRILPGQYYDKETNTSYNYFRDYDPAVGRYVQSDPIGLVGGLNWSSQDSVDTDSRSPSCCFELLGAYPTEMTVPTSSIVERLDVI
jgi:RHS repeat-associated protein